MTVDGFGYADASNAGVNDFAQAAGVRAQVIVVIHDLDAWAIVSAGMAEAA